MNVLAEVAFISP